MKFVIPFIILLIINCSGTAQTKVAPSKPKLIIGIVVEGMRADFLTRYQDQFSDGGFNRMLKNGTQFTNAEYDHLIAESSAGYATISSGTPPSQHGIVGNTWFQRLTGNEIYCVSDDKTVLIGTESKAKGFSPVNMLVNTVGDELKSASYKQSKVISIAPNDYAAILAGGHSADIALWFDKNTGDWISSSFYAAELPNWVKRFNNKRLPDLYLEKLWTPFQDLPRYKSSMGDESPYEKGFEGGKKTFPYTLSSLKADAGNFGILHATPEGNTIVKDLAVSAIVNEDLGRDQFPDLLMLGFSAGANIGQYFDIRSMEHADIYLRLDQELERFFDFVNDYVGLENTLIFVTSDRGSSDSPDFLKDMRQPYGIFKEQAAISLLRSYMRALYNKGGFIDGFSANQLYLRRTDIEDSKISLEEVQTKTAEFLIEFGGVSNVVTAKDLETSYFADGMLRKAQNSYFRKRSGDVMLILQPGYRNENGKSNHSGYREFTHVPLVFFGWKTQHQTIHRNVLQTDIAPTLSQILQIAPPNATTGKVLTELQPAK